MRELTNEQIRRYQNMEIVGDIVDSFLEEFAEEAMGVCISKVELFKAFKEFCEKYYIRQAFYLNEMSFGRIMKKLGYKDSRRTINNRQCYVWLGIKAT